MRKWFFILILFPFLVKGQGIIIGDTTSSNIFYKNIPDTTLPFLVKSTSSCDIDFDIDSNNDIKFSFTHGSSPSHTSIYRNVQALSNIEFAYISNSAYADTFPAGYTINNTLNWKSTGIGLYYYYSGPPQPWGPGTYSVGVFNSTNCYLGFRKIANNDTIYGWFLCDMNSTIKIRSFAFEKKCASISGSITVNTSSPIICTGETATLTASGASTYTWNTGSNSNSIVINPNTTTTYTVNGTTSLDCPLNSVITQSVDACIGIREFESSNSFNIFPNPSAGKVSLVFENGYLPKNRKGVIYDSNGRKVMGFEINSAEASSIINTDELPNGVYTIKLQDHDRSFIKRLVIAR